MAILQNVLLGFLAGHFTLQARVESMWWSHFGSDLSALKSRVPSSVRFTAESFYRQLLEAPPNFDYALIAITVTVFLSLVGGIVKRPEKRFLSIVSFITFTAAAVIEIFYARPIMNSFRSKSYMKPEVQTMSLYQVSMLHAGVLALLAITALVQVSMVEADEEELEKAKAAAKSAKKPKKE
ncbi:hypothetical protein MT418_001967 [Batrachochytrium dendrobatidis]